MNLIREIMPTTKCMFLMEGHAVHQSDCNVILDIYPKDIFKHGSYKLNTYNLSLIYALLGALTKKWKPWGF